jgi:hypothetical protein
VELSTILLFEPSFGFETRSGPVADAAAVFMRSLVNPLSLGCHAPGAAAAWSGGGKQQRALLHPLQPRFKQRFWSIVLLRSVLPSLFECLSLVASLRSLVARASSRIPKMAPRQGKGDSAPRRFNNTFCNFS